MLLAAGLTAEVPLNLIPMCSDFTQPPSKTDIERHRPLLLSFMHEFPSKAPNESEIVAGCS